MHACTSRALGAEIFGGGSEVGLRQDISQGVNEAAQAAERRNFRRDQARSSAAEVGESLEPEAEAPGFMKAD
jgi:hypothetical protein